MAHAFLDFVVLKLREPNEWIIVTHYQQGGILSGPIFCEYMNFLNEMLKKAEGYAQFGQSWNALFYADDVLLLCKSKTHAQELLKICENFQMKGFISWNSTKTKVLNMLPSNHNSENIPTKSELELNGCKLDRVVCVRWLGYMLNHFLNDDNMIRRQASRLYAISNNLSSDLPLELLDDSTVSYTHLTLPTIYSV